MAFPTFSIMQASSALYLYREEVLLDLWKSQAEEEEGEEKIAACVFDLEAIEDVSSAIGCRRSAGRAIKLASSNVWEA